ncbi:COX15/CtaA family protein [Caldimonas caldifontis]|uniref:Heme A synthase n=1 Tax=Caldimonas caldifontis TaxID=1452508 RepID=A0A2S5SZP7_9BURK|nr:COX15/CtaA family protein [Caldimonas caldifontis]PPE68162.1 heme A synthase [Caldimonas caldifontis]
METQALYDLTPIARLALLGIVIALGPLAWVWLRNRHAAPSVRLAALTALTLFLTFDLVVFGAFTRLTDSGLGCPDWPGCYGAASPVGARAEITAAQTAMPTGPVTHKKAWIEMIHRYLATGVGVLIMVMAITSWLERRRLALSPWWATATLVWVCVQGAFGALTVTMKLYPAVVTAHLLGGLCLLALLAAQHQVYRARQLVLSRGMHRLAWGLFMLLWLQIALGGWVSTNYAVLACPDFPTCHGQWWPAMDFHQGFQIARPLGERRDGGYLTFDALTAIHYTHRLAAYVVLAALVGYAAALWRRGAAHRRYAGWLLGGALWQFVSGLSNVVLGWPLVAALAHTAGAAGLVIVLTALLTQAHQARRAVTAAHASMVPLSSASGRTAS